MGGKDAVSDPVGNLDWLDLNTKEFDKGPNLNIPRNYHATVDLDGYLYTVGGHKGDDYIDTVERLNYRAD